MTYVFCLVAGAEEDVVAQVVGVEKQLLEVQVAWLEEVLQGWQKVAARFDSLHDEHVILWVDAYCYCLTG